MERLSGRVRIPWGIRVLISIAVVSVVLLLVDRFVVTIPMAYIVGAAALLTLLGGVYVFRRYQRWRFDLETDALVLKRGVVTHVDTVVPYVRIQHVDTQRGPVERLLGLSSLVVYTAGTRGADVSIPGLTMERADALQEQLRELARDSEPTDAV